MDRGWTGESNSDNNNNNNNDDDDDDDDDEKQSKIAKRTQAEAHSSALIKRERLVSGS